MNKMGMVKKSVSICIFEKLRRVSAACAAAVILSTAVNVPVMAQENAGTENPMHLSKSLTENDDGTYTVKLEQYAEAEKDYHNKPTDVVLVLDISGSMVQGNLGDVLKLTAMQNAVYRFIDSMEESNSGKSADEQSRVAILTFSDVIGNKVINDMMPVNSDTSAGIKNKIAQLNCRGNTHTGEAMNMCRSVLESDNLERRKCAILFTDGQPCYNDYGFSIDGANTAISESQRIKAAGNEVFTVSIEKTSRTMMPWELPEYTPAADEGAGNVNYFSPYLITPDSGDHPNGCTIISDENMMNLNNRFLQLLTSNYPGAGNLHSPGTVAAVDSKVGTYCLAADNSDKLSTVFQNIYSSISSAGTIPDGTAQIRDLIADDFVLAEDEPIITYTMDALPDENGEISWVNKKDAEGLTVTADTDVVKVEGFDYEKNAVIIDGYPNDPGFYGRKLVVEFKVRLKNRLFGGNNIPSNKDTSGIYKDGEGDDIIAKYPVPHADIPLQYEINCNDLEIYAPDLGKLKDIPGFDDNYIPDGINNAYVNIKYSLTDDSGKTVGTLDIPAKTAATAVSWQMAENEDIAVCGNYHLNCTVSPVEEGPEKEIFRTEDAVVHVYYPAILLKDTTQTYGDEADIAEGPAADPEKAKAHVTILGWTCSDVTVPDKENRPEIGVSIRYPDGIAVENGKNIIRSIDDLNLEIKAFRLVNGSFDQALEVTQNTVFTHSCDRQDCSSVNGANTNNNICKIHVRKRVLNITSGSAEKTYDGKALTYKSASEWITSGTDEKINLYVNEALKDPATDTDGYPQVYVSDFSRITGPGSVRNDFSLKGIYLAVNNAEGSRILKEVTEGYTVETSTGILKVNAKEQADGNNDSKEPQKKTEVKKNIVKQISVEPVPANVENKTEPETADKGKNSPSTGDESKADIYMMLLFLSGILLFVWIIARKTKKLYEN